jgi:hypothetical protein
MKHFFTISLCFLALSLSAQVPGGVCCDPDGLAFYSGSVPCLGLEGGSYPADGCIEDTGCPSYNPSDPCLVLCEGQFDECGICDGPGALYE